MESTTAATSTVVEGERVPLVTDLERADLELARRLAEEEFHEVREQRRRREEADRAVAAQYQYHPRRIEPIHPYYYGAWRNHERYVRNHEANDWCCFCWFFWCIWLWLVIFLLLIILLPYYLEKYR